MNKDFIVNTLIECCRVLYLDSKNLIVEKAHERTIVSRMVPYLKSQFSGYSVDPEYNREGSFEKRETKKDIDNNPILPDLIIHKYGPNGENLVAIEVKGYWNKESREIDEEKLRKLHLKQGYKFLYRIELGRDKADLIEVL